MFPAKLLLFGEYAVLYGSPALAAPLASFGGQWVNDGQPDPHHDRLKEWIAHIPAMQLPVRTAELEAAVNSGYRFVSDIPPGCGMGSSGALCAAVYKHFGPDTAPDILTLKTHLATLESFFHGNSSGLDPLVSYLQTPVYIEGDQLRAVTIYAQPQPWRILAYHSGLPRQTRQLVGIFKSQMQDAAFASLITDTLSVLNREAIDAFLTADSPRLQQQFEQISALQFEHLRFLIPESLHARWLHGLQTGEYYMKICGAGGGGYFLIFQPDALTPVPFEGVSL